MQSPELPGLKTNPDLLAALIVDSQEDEMSNLDFYARLMILQRSVALAITKAKKKIMDDLEKDDINLKHGTISMATSISYEYKGDTIYDNLMLQIEARKVALRMLPTTNKSTQKRIKWIKNK